MKIKNSIVIHGPGRSGTTLLSNILSLQSELAWISNYNNKFPKSPILALFNRVQGNPWIEQFNRDKRKWPRPSEAYDFWLYFFSNFNEIEHPQEDQKSFKRCINTINKIINYSGKGKFITKLTGVSRHYYIENIFENPSIIYIDRDPRAVVMSFYKQKWWYKNRLELFNSLDQIDLIKFYTSKYFLFYKQKKQLTKFKFIQVHYEDLVENPTLFFGEVCEKLDLDFDDQFQAYIKSWSIRKNTNNSWKAAAKPESIDYLNAALQKPIDELGYKIEY